MPFLLLLFGTAYSLFYLKLSTRWWIEDDPALYASASGITNPVAIFGNPGLVKHFSAGRALVPMQILSYWMDVQLAGFSPRFAYWHQAFSFVLTLLFLYLVLVELLNGNRGIAFFAAFSWAMLPATAAVVQFASTRHYLEGLLFSLISVRLLQQARKSPDSARPRILSIALVAAAAALLCKEIYAATLAPILLLYSWYYRGRKFGIATVTTLCTYAVYRFWVIGPVFDYGMPLLSATQYLKFLSKLPYTIAANYGGYAIAAAILALCAYALHRQGRGASLVLLCCAGIFAASLLAVLPVSAPLYGTIRVPGTWYRIVFLPHTIAIVCVGYLLAHCASRWIRIAVMIVFVVSLVPGLVKTRTLWRDLAASAEREGRFYLDNPDKVLLSEQDAWWFIPGIHLMYHVGNPHYVLLKDPRHAAPPLTAQLVWRYRGGQFVPQYFPALHGPKNR